MPSRDALNRCRYDGSERGHYESWFQRANHPSRPLAFWIRYTIFSPSGAAADAVGELWAIVFDGERGTITAAKQVHPIAECRFSSSGLDAKIASATVDRSNLRGEARQGTDHLQWALTFEGDAPPLLLLPPKLYDTPLPKAKALVGTPLARFSGELHVNGERIEVDEWVGSQNHNWGRQHTDHYAWGQVAGFDDAPDAFLEVSTARLKVGPFWTPWLTPLVLRLDGQEHALTGLGQAWRARGSFEPFHWAFHSSAPGISIEGTISADPKRFVGLRYGNPPGGEKICLNSKLATCTLVVTREGKPTRELHTECRAAFEILGDDVPEGVLVVA